jgi:Flp pilus assembly protein TadG
MRRLDQRGTAAFEFCLVAVPFFMLIFAIFDLGRYAITMQSLRALANAGARAMMIQCYTPAVVGTLANTTPSNCTGSYMTPTQMQNVVPFLYAGNLSPSLTIQVQGSALVVTASQPGFSMMVPLWGTTLNAPSASTSVPF